MKGKIIGVDICNTIADVMGELNKRFGNSPTPNVYFHPGLSGIPTFFEDNLDVFLDAKVIESSNIVLRELAKANKIVYITARPEKAYFVTKLWLKRNGFPKGEIYFTKEKPKIANMLKVDVVFEDAPHEIDNYLQYSKDIEVMVKRQPYNLEFDNLFDWNDTKLAKLAVEAHR